MMSTKHIVTVNGVIHAEMTQAELDQRAVDAAAQAVTDAARDAENNRLATYMADAARTAIIAHTRNDALPELATYIRGLVDVDSIVGLTQSQQAGLKRIETAIVRLTQALASRNL